LFFLLVTGCSWYTTDPDDTEKEELSSYPMSEGTFSELCVAIKNDNGDDVGDEGDDDIDYNEDFCLFHTV
jgi:hypothetical protein